MMDWMPNVAGQLKMAAILALFATPAASASAQEFAGQDWARQDWAVQNLERSGYSQNGLYVGPHGFLRSHPPLLPWKPGYQGLFHKHGYADAAAGPWMMGGGYSMAEMGGLSGGECCSPMMETGCCGSVGGGVMEDSWAPLSVDPQGVVVPGAVGAQPVPNPTNEPTPLRAKPVVPGTPTPIVPRSAEPTSLPANPGEGLEKIDLPDVPLPRDAKAKAPPATSQRFRTVPGAARVWYATSGSKTPAAALSDAR